MEAIRSEVIKHMLEASDARQTSPLFRLPGHWSRFNEWCRESPEATFVVSRAAESIETFCLDQDQQLYCIAMSLDTLEKVIKSLVDAYEDLELDRLMEAA